MSGILSSREHGKQEAGTVKHAVHSDSHYCGSSATGSEEGSEDEEEENLKNPKKSDVYGCAHSNGLPVCGFVKANLDGETESRNVEEKVCGDAYTCGFPICGLVKVHPNDRIHKSAYSRESSTCGH